MRFILLAGFVVQMTIVAGNWAALRQECEDKKVSTVLQISDNCATEMLKLSKGDYKGLSGSDFMKVFDDFGIIISASIYKLLYIEYSDFTRHRTEEDKSGLPA